MYQRLRTTADVQLLQAGTLLIKYPLSGDAMNEIDLSVPDGFDLYEVQSIEEDVIRLLFRPDIVSDSRLAGNPETNNSAAHALSTFIVMQADSLLADENWWRNEELIPA